MTIFTLDKRRYQQGAAGKYSDSRPRHVQQQLNYHHNHFYDRLQVVFYNDLLVEKMIKLASSGCTYDSRVRLVTLEILIASLHMIVIR